MAIFNTCTKKAIPNTKTGTEPYGNPGKINFGCYFIYLQDWKAMSSHRGHSVGMKTGRVQDKCWMGGVISGQVESPTCQKVWSKLWFGASVLWLVLEKTVICRELSCKNCDLRLCTPDKCRRGKCDLGCDSNSEITTLGLRPENFGKMARCSQNGTLTNITKVISGWDNFSLLWNVEREENI